MDVTLKDIASQAGVSISTVSRVLNQGPDLVHPTETQRKIIECARSLGYVSQKINTYQSIERPSYHLACVFASDHESIASPFFSELHDGLVDGVKKLAGRYDLSFVTLNLTVTGVESDLSSPSLDGVILLGRITKETIETLRKQIPHLVYAGLNQIDGIDNVVSDIRFGVKAVTDRLVALGHRKIAYVGPTDQDGTLVNEYRYQTYVDALASHGIPLDKRLVADSYLEASDGYRATMQLLDAGAKPTAIICGNDNLAIGVTRALAKRGLSVPEDISLFGYDNIPDSAYLSPSLSTVDVPKREIGQYALRLLLDAIENHRSWPITVTLPFRLIERESTKEVFQ
ncbi:MAG: LacI family DNA-binding transcriptional regulator [Sphaerochaetaceae bacterium]|nr:LacI family DNA-binding transcriptional regulator [Spirochaetales bacterium]MDY5500534.1 LacI family DNA-binding transcriptional regulator [Sphaerochaetaceae bacterium]